MKKDETKHLKKKKLLIQRTSVYEAKELCEEVLGHKIAPDDEFGLLASATLSLEIANQKLGKNSDFRNVLGIGEGLVKITQMQAPDEEHERLKEAILSAYEPDNGFNINLMRSATNLMNQRRNYVLSPKPMKGVFNRETEN